MDTATQAPAKEKYEALRSNLKELYTLFFDMYVKATGTFMIVLGWLISSKDARAFILGNEAVYCAALITLASLAALYITLCRRMWRKSARIMCNLQALGYMEPEYYGNYSISRHSIVIIISGYLFIVAIVCVMLTKIYNPALL